jgi:hypothetical protein
VAFAAGEGLMLIEVVGLGNPSLAPIQFFKRYAHRDGFATQKPVYLQIFISFINNYSQTTHELSPVIFGQGAPAVGGSTNCVRGLIKYLTGPISLGTIPESQDRLHSQT